jgi:TRAP-type C4-dicarboxylate transport system substrate-binding protein
MNLSNFHGRAWIVLTAALAMGAAACGAGSVDKAGGAVSKPDVLTLADGEADTDNALPFATAVSTLSGGTLQIEVEGDWRPSDPNYETGLIKDVQAGKAELGITASRAFDTAGINSFQALQAPFLIDSIALERKVLASAIPGTMLGGLTAHGLVGLGMLPGPLRRPLGLTRPLVAVSDYKEAMIGIRASGVTEAIFRALGATSAVLKRDNDVSGLTGMESHLTNIDSAFGVHGGTLTGNVVFQPRPNVIFMNRRAFGSLNPAQQRVLIRAAQAQTAGDVYEADDGSLRDMCRRGLTVVAASRADLAGLRAAVQPVYRELESNPSTRAFIIQITAMRQAGVSPDAVSCPPAGTPAQNATTLSPLEGRWAVTFTQSQLEAAGPSTSCDPSNPANYGYFTLRFDRGRWWETSLPETNGNASGTYVTNGDKVTFYRNDDAYPGSDTEVWGPYIWSVYRDTLTFKNVGSGGPCLYVQPWHKIGT